MRLVLPLVLVLLFAPTAPTQTETDQKILDMASEIEARVAEIRGRPFKKTVEKGIYTKKQLEGFILASFEKELPDEKAARWEAALKLFGMIPQEMDLKKTFVEFLVSQVGGFYDPETKSLKCISTNLTFLAHIVMAHELLHSLQDQYVDLEQYYKAAEFNDDIVAARQAVIEGEAQHLTTVYAQRYPLEMAADMADMKPEDLSAFLIDQLAATAGAPPYFMEVMTFPYIDGERFVKAGKQQMGWPIVDVLYKSPPRSSEQILHPEKFFDDRDEPVKIDLPDLCPTLGDGFELYHENSLGELQIKILIKLTADSIRAMRASAGWDGDTYAVYRNRSDGRCLLAWAVTFDSVSDAAEFFDAEVKALRRKYDSRREEEDPGGYAVIGPDEKDGTGSGFFSADGAMAYIELRGCDVCVVDNVPEGAEYFSALCREIWNFTKGEFDFEAIRPVPYGQEPEQKTEKKKELGKKSDGPW